LKIFALEVDGAFQVFTEMVGKDQFGVTDPLLQPFGRLTDQGEGKEGSPR
jgi:hypothetical protein